MHAELGKKKTLNSRHKSCNYQNLAQHLMVCLIQILVFIVFKLFTAIFNMSLSTDQDVEHTEYHNWLLHIQDQQLREELIEILSIFQFLSAYDFHLF